MDAGIALTWRPASGVTGYEISRTNNGSMTVIATTTDSHWLDTTAASNQVYVYEIRGVIDPVTRTAASNRELASTLAFDEDPTIARHTPVRANHILQLRDAINQLRIAAGLGAQTFPSLTNSIRAQDVIDLRDALAPALTAISAPPLNSHFFAAGHLIERWHLQELRDRLR